MGDINKEWVEKRQKDLKEKSEESIELNKKRAKELLLDHRIVKEKVLEFLLDKKISDATELIVRNFLELYNFYTIRSDLIDDAHYMGSLDSGEKLPVIAHVLKTTDSGDYFTSQDSSLEFTMTRSKPLSTITTAICDPDGSFSRVDDNSAVIYKVQRQNQLPMNLVQALFGGNAP